MAKKNEHIVKGMISDFNYNVINQKEIIELLHSVRKVYGFTNYRLADFIEYIEDICNVEEVSSANERMSVIPLYAKPKADIYDLAAASSRRHCGRGKRYDTGIQQYDGWHPLRH